MLQYIATYLYTRRGNKEESIKNARNDEQKQKEKREKWKQRKKNKRKKERHFFLNKGIQKENLTYEVIKERKKERKKKTKIRKKKLPLKKGYKDKKVTEI